MPFKLKTLSIACYSSSIPKGWSARSGTVDTVGMRPS